MHTGCTPENPLCIRCTSGVPPVYSARRVGESCGSIRNEPEVCGFAKGYHAGDGAFNRLCDDLGFGLAGGEQQAAAAFENGADPHGDGTVGHLIHPAESRDVLL